MSCSVCTCTHHLAWHGDPDSTEIGPCTVGDCGCVDFQVLDATAWATSNVRKL
jgi:hypothetical protein